MSTPETQVPAAFLALAPTESHPRELTLSLTTAGYLQCDIFVGVYAVGRISSPLTDCHLNVRHGDISVRFLAIGPATILVSEDEVARIRETFEKHGLHFTGAK